MMHEIAGRAWDSFDGYLFDIDGTLLHCTDAVHYFAFCAALRSVTGRDTNLDGVVTQGNVDVGILRDAFVLAGVGEERWRPRLEELQVIMAEHVGEHAHEFCADVLPGVRQVLDHLRGSGKTLGVATGNLQAIGEAKLRHTGLLEFFTVGGWSDAYEQRADVFRGAIAQMRHAAGPGAAICVVGDTPSDVLAAQANGVPVVAVATGVYPRAELEALRPDLCLDSCAELLAGRP